MYGEVVGGGQASALTNTGTTRTTRRPGGNTASPDGKGQTEAWQSQEPQTSSCSGNLTLQASLSRGPLPKEAVAHLLRVKKKKNPIEFLLILKDPVLVLSNKKHMINSQ